MKRYIVFLFVMMFSVSVCAMPNNGPVGCSEEWVAWEQTVSGPAVTLPATPWTANTQVLVTGAGTNWTETASSDAAADCFSWGTSGKLQFQYDCAQSRYYHVKMVMTGKATWSGGTNPMVSVMMSAGTGSGVVVGDIVASSITFAGMEHGVFSLVYHTFRSEMDVQLDENDYVAALVKMYEAASTATFLALGSTSGAGSTRIVFTTQTCMRGLP